MVQYFDKKFLVFNSTKEDGNVSIKFDESNETENNINKFFEKIRIHQKKCLFMDCLFKDVIVELDDNYFNSHLDLSQESVHADAIITKCKNVFIYEKFADCTPFIVYDKKQEILAFAHMGWQSIELDLHKKLINQLVISHNSKLSDLVIYIGPSIKAESYVLENPSQLKYEIWKPYLSNVVDSYYKVDLNGYILDGLLEMKIDEEQITNSNINTATDKNYFSHYRCIYIDKNEKEGRFICGAGIIE